jgi:hypothetical protein
VIALAASLVLASCGEDDKSTPRAPADRGAIELTIRAGDGARRASTGTLTCRSGEQRATGALLKRAPASRLCSDARKLAPLLTTQAPAGRKCTQIYGGPQTAQITGTIDGRRVDRTFKRTNGCAIEEYARVAKILPP